VVGLGKNPPVAPVHKPEVEPGRERVSARNGESIGRADFPLKRQHPPGPDPEPQPSTARTYGPVSPGQKPAVKRSPARFDPETSGAAKGPDTLHSGVVEDRRPGPDGLPDEARVEPVPHHHPDDRIGPGDPKNHPVAHRHHRPADLDFHGRADLERDEPDRSAREPAAAGLVPGQGLLFEDRRPNTPPGEEIPEHRSGRAGADDDHVVRFQARHHALLSNE